MPTTKQFDTLVLDGLPPDESFFDVQLQSANETNIKRLFNEAEAVLERAEKEAMHFTFVVTVRGSVCLPKSDRETLVSFLQTNSVYDQLHDSTGKGDNFFAVTKSGWIVKYLLKGAFLLAECDLDSDSDDEEKTNTSVKDDKDDTSLAKLLDGLTINEPPKTRSKTRGGRN